ncbi:hypothetical protein [Halothermothrix orenii]|uniref:hypothetical protein n=1 Tax=Halothermothrix orenii TaxID=31909 RepID=UPI0002DC8B80|nr:hypothetical protein [Halothermothrix orenii]
MSVKQINFYGKGPVKTGPFSIKKVNLRKTYKKGSLQKAGKNITYTIYYIWEGKCNIYRIKYFIETDNSSLIFQAG